MAVYKRASAQGVDTLEAIEREVVDCRACPRLVAWREEVGRTKKAAFRNEDYWARPLPGFGDPHARVYVLGLAPAAHGGNRTGRIFTGDRSGDWLFGSLYRSGFANQPDSQRADDGLRLSDCFIGAAVRCAPPQNRPRVEERDRCLAYTERELDLVPVRVIVCLGSFAWDAAARILSISPRPRFTHAAEHRANERPILLGCYHPSQQNTFTGRLTTEMIDAVFGRARELSGIEPA